MNDFKKLSEENKIKVIKYYQCLIKMKYEDQSRVITKPEYLKSKKQMRKEIKIMKIIVNNK